MPNFIAIEREINDLLECTAALLTASEREEIQEFLKAGEFGLALETFSDIVVEEKKQINVVILNKCKAIAQQMEMSPETCEKIQSYVR
jgi:hypothetical protein